jgi:hypothetical protein
MVLASTLAQINRAVNALVPKLLFKPLVDLLCAAHLTVDITA